MEYSLTWQQEAYLDATGFTIEEYLNEYAYVRNCEPDELEQDDIDYLMSEDGMKYTIGGIFTGFYTAEQAAKTTLDTYFQATNENPDISDYGKFMDDLLGKDDTLYCTTDPDGNVWYYWNYLDYKDHNRFIAGIKFAIDNQAEIDEKEMAEWMEKHNIEVDEDNKVIGLSSATGYWYPYIYNYNYDCWANVSGSSIEYIYRHKDEIEWWKS